MSPCPPSWTLLTSRPLGTLRSLSGLSLGRLAVALGRPDEPGARATLSNAAARDDVLLSTLREWADRLGFELEIRVRKKS